MTKLILPRWETPDPPGVVGTYGDRAIAWAKRELRIVPGPWQAYVIRKLLRYDAAGNLIHRVALVSTGRQNGKSIIVRIVLGWLLDEGQKLGPFSDWTTLIAAAHDAKQARIVYRGVLRDLSGIDRLREQSRGRTPDVRLTQYFGVTVHGLTLDTASSEPGSVRGESAGIVAWDEMLTQHDWNMMEAMRPIISAQRSSQMLMTSTAGHLDSIVLRFFYDMMVRQATGDEKPDPTFYGVWWQSEDAEAKLDWRELLRANPALDDGRLDRALIEGEYRMMPADSWKRERLNHFVDTIADGAFGPGQWAAVRASDPLAGTDGPYALGVAVGPDWQRATVAVAAIRQDGRIGTAVFKDLRAGAVPLTADDVLGAVHSFEGYAAVVAYDSTSAGAPAFRRDAETGALPWDELKSGAVISACMDVAEMVQSGTLAVDDPLLDAQVAMMGRRAVGTDGLFRFARSASTGPIDAALAMVYAAHAIRFSQEIGIYIPA